MELDTLTKEKSILSETNSKLSRELQMIQSENNHLEKSNEKLTKENKDKMNLISQLEKVRYKIFTLFNVYKTTRTRMLKISLRYV